MVVISKKEEGIIDELWNAAEKEDEYVEVKTSQLEIVLNILDDFRREQKKRLETE